MIAPHRIDSDTYAKPAVLSAHCVYWMGRIVNGWQPNKRINRLGYYSSAAYLGVYIWEYLNVIYPMLSGTEPKERMGGHAAGDS